MPYVQCKCWQNKVQINQNHKTISEQSIQSFKCVKNITSSTCTSVFMCVCVCAANMHTHSSISSLGDLGVTEVHLCGNVISLLMHQSMSCIIHHHGDAWRSSIEI